MAANLLCRIRWAARQACDCESDGGITTVAGFQWPVRAAGIWFVIPDRVAACSGELESVPSRPNPRHLAEWRVVARLLSRSSNADTFKSWPLLRLEDQ